MTPFVQVLAGNLHSRSDAYDELTDDPIPRVKYHWDEVVTNYFAVQPGGASPCG